jgi:hypothetical protein
VGPHRVHRDEQVTGDRGAVAALGQQLEDLALALGEQGQPLACLVDLARASLERLDHPGEQARRDAGLALGHADDRRHEVLHRVVGRHEPCGAVAEALDDELLVLLVEQEQDPRGRHGCRAVAAPAAQLGQQRAPGA